MKKILLSLACLCLSIFCWADSPLTSTHFSARYQNLPIMEVVEIDGLTDQVVNFLMDSTAVLELRLAVVNYLGWDIEGQSNYYYLLDRARQIFLAFSEDEGAILEQCTPDMLCVMAYAKAMDDYFDVADAARIAAMAERRCPQSRAIAMIHALIEAQITMDSDWCLLYRQMADKASQTFAKKDFTDWAVAQIMEYVNLYDCDKK